ncbi:MAG: alpha/beta fold hydrolase [Candidatus Hydrogenedentes bacterium]|nr:alpha/beta fold hydrolase [Candidatus Hydrogenedentota bacterium]
MNVERWGDGERVYLGIHGWAGNHRTFRPIAENAPEDVSFFSVDLPGYGASPPPQNWDLETVASGLTEIVRALPGGATTLVGYCGGAALGLLVVQELSDRISRIVMIDPFAYMPWYFRVFTWGEFGRRAYMSTFASKRGRRITNTALQSKRSGDTDLTRSFEAVNHELTLDAIRAFAAFPSYQVFAPLHLEVDLVYGERSFKAVKRGVKMWQALWPHARAYELSGAGHDPIREATEPLRAIVFGSDAC